MSKRPQFDVVAFLEEQGLFPCPQCSLPGSPMKWKVYHTPEHPCPRQGAGPLPAEEVK